MGTIFLVKGKTIEIDEQKQKLEPPFFESRLKISYTVDVCLKSSPINKSSKVTAANWNSQGLGET